MPEPFDAFLGCLRRRGETFFRVWAPAAGRVEVEFEATDVPPLTLRKSADGYFCSSTSAEVSLYKYRVDDTGPWPDPCSRYQPQGVHGPSLVVEPDTFGWTDAAWRGAQLKGQVIYELHIGTFTPEGTFDAAAQKLGYLHDVGATMIEVMPVAQCPGRFNWGYDGVRTLKGLFGK